MKTTLSIAAITAACGVASAIERPNMLIYISDDHGFAQSEPYGDTFVKTPNMAQIASQGMTFDRAYVASPASGPSRGALLSGMVSPRNGAISNHSAPTPSSQQMVRLLQAQGYEVVAIGKIAHGDKQTEMCGFDYTASAKPIDATVEEYLKSRTSTKPLCLMVGDKRPHVTWGVANDYDVSKITLPDNLIDTPPTREHWGRYLTDITGLDTSIGNINKMYEEYLGNDDYLFIYSADHGAQWPFGKWNLYEQGVRTPLIARWKGHIEANTRTDAMVSWLDLMPTLIDIAGGETSDSIDGRSFTKVLNNPKAKHRNEIYTTHTSDGAMNLYPIRAVRNERYKYIKNLHPEYYHSNHSDILRKDGAGAYWDSWEAAAKSDPAAKEIISRYYQRPAEELYDLVNDPHEEHNLANNPKYNKIKRELSTKLAKWMEESGDTQEMKGVPYPLSGPTPHEVAAAKAAKRSKK